MPLPFPKTIARDKVFSNIATLEGEGRTRSQSIAIAFNAARKEYFKRFPQGALPEWLTYKKAMRRASDYAADGAPMQSNPVSAKVKQASRLFKSFTGDAPERTVSVSVPGAGFDTGMILGYALGLDLEDRDGLPVGHLKFDAKNYPALAVSADGKKAVFIGGDFSPLEAFVSEGVDKFVVLRIMYQTVRDGVQEKYQHPFARNARPLLAVLDGRNAKMSGGSFRFTSRGFVDFAR